MPTRYAVFQYTPDPVSGERINIGVVVYDERTVLVRFLKRWKRVRAFAGKDISFLRHFAERVEESADPSLLITDVGPVVELNHELVQRMSERWAHAIQLTEPRASTLEPRALLARIAPKFLRDSGPAQREGLTRHAAISAALSGIRAALTEESGAEGAKELLKPGGILRGELTENRFDALVANGSPILAANALSFQTQDAKELAHNVNAIAFSLSDVRHRLQDLALALVAIPPRFDISGEYERARTICAGLNVDVIDQNQVESWARPVVREYLG